MLDDDLLILVNGSPRAVTFTIPETGTRSCWRTELDRFDLAADSTTPGTVGATDTTGAVAAARTGTRAGRPDPASIGAGDHVTVRPRSQVLR